MGDDGSPHHQSHGVIDGDFTPASSHGLGRVIERCRIAAITAPPLSLRGPRRQSNLLPDRHRSAEKALAAS